MHIRDMLMTEGILLQGELVQLPIAIVLLLLVKCWSMGNALKYTTVHTIFLARFLYVIKNSVVILLYFVQH